MHNVFDFSSWQSVLSTLLGLALFSLVVVGIRLLVMHTVQLRRERENRQINERLRTLIAAYKVLGGSFTGDLVVDPAHLRDSRSTDARSAGTGGEDADESHAAPRRDDSPGAERRRRIRDAVEAALSDVILLGTEDQVRLAARAASDMVSGRTVETAELVVSLRDFIRDVLDLEAVGSAVAIPRQGPLRPAGGGGGRAREQAGRDGGGAPRGAGRAGGQGGGSAAAGLGLGGTHAHGSDDAEDARG